jgi:hypothetical protein
MPAKGNARSRVVTNNLNVELLENTLKYKGEVIKGVYMRTIGQPCIQSREQGIPVTTILGFNTWAALEGSPDHAAVAADFTIAENEVPPVIRAMVENGIKVIADHLTWTGTANSILPPLLGCGK